MTFAMIVRKRLICDIKRLVRCVTNRRPYCVSKNETERTVRLSYASYQPTNQLPVGPPLILIHGLFGSKKNLAAISKALGRSRKVVSVDCRNHGDSPHVAEMDYLLMAEDIERLLAELNIPRAVIFGHSMGGKVGMTLALTKPQLVSKLLVEDVSPNVTRNADTTSFPAYLAAMRDVEFDDSLSASAMRQSAGEQLKPTFPEKPVRDFVVTNIVRVDDQYTWRINIDSILANLDALMGFPDLPLAYTGPTLFLGGSLSTHITDSDHPEILRFFPRAEIQHVEGAGHWVHSEKPHDVLRVFLEFLDTQHTDS